MERARETIIKALDLAPASVLHICDLKRAVELDENSPFTLEEILSELHDKGAIERSGLYVGLR